MEHIDINNAGGQKLRLRRLLPKFETRQKARERNRKLVKHLKAGEKAERKVGQKLRRCRKDKPCSSPMCPRCVRELRASFVRGAMQCIDQVRKADGIPDDQIVAFSAVLPEEQYPAGALHKADQRRINERIQRRHQRAGLPLVLAGVDISFNEDSTGRWAPHWQLHVYGVCVGLDRKELRRRLAKFYPSNATTPKPLRVRKCENTKEALARALSYAIKPYFGRRANYRDKTGRFTTRKVSLKRPQVQELTTWINGYPLTARYALTGCRRYGDRIERT